MSDDAFARMVAAYGALLERLITDTSEALPSAFPGMSVVHRQGDERPQDAEVMVDLRLVPGRPLDGEVFLRTDGDTLRVTHRVPAANDDHIETSVVELYRTSAQVNLVAFAWAAMARKVAITLPITGAALLLLLRDDLREEVEA
jgi:hypothetical protein